MGKKDEKRPPRQPRSKLPELVGRIGKAATDMCLTGIILLDGHPYDALSECFFIEKGAWVEVIMVKLGQLIVTEYSS